MSNQYNIFRPSFLIDPADGEWTEAGRPMAKALNEDATQSDASRTAWAKLIQDYLNERSLPNVLKCTTTASTGAFDGTCTKEDIDRAINEVRAIMVAPSRGPEFGFDFGPAPDPEPVRILWLDRAMPLRSQLRAVEDQSRRVVLIDTTDTSEEALNELVAKYCEKPPITLKDHVLSKSYGEPSLKRPQRASKANPSVVPEVRSKSKHQRRKQRGW